MVSIVTLFSPLASAFFSPLGDALPQARSSRSCPELSDRDWVFTGVARVIEAQPSGRAFLQHAAAILPGIPARTTFFEALASARRLTHCREVAEVLARRMPRLIADPFAAFPALAAFDLYAADGHFHAAAIHDPRDNTGNRHATGHVFQLDLRTRAMRHIDLGDRLTRHKEHDLRIIKRQELDTLRCHAAKGRKVIIAYDRAILDFVFWHKAKQTAGLYFISRPKSNTNLTRCGYLEFDEQDPVNAGVITDEQAAPVTHGHMIRRITWQDPDTGAEWQFLTNEMTLAPGLVVLLYRRRWDIEKVFDEFKNKLGERKSWATSPTAKSAHATFLCLAHNLIVLWENELARRGIRNTAEEKRRASRLEKRTGAAAAASRKMPSIITGVQRLTQYSVKLVRWLRSYLWSRAPLDELCLILTQLYKTL